VALCVESILDRLAAALVHWQKHLMLIKGSFLRLLTQVITVQHHRTMSRVGQRNDDSMVKKCLMPSLDVKKPLVMEHRGTRYSLRIAADSAGRCPERNCTSSCLSHPQATSPSKMKVFNEMIKPVTPDFSGDSVSEIPKRGRNRKRSSKDSTISDHHPIGDEPKKKLLCQIPSQNPWIDLQVPPEELRPSSTLTTGQCFQWIAIEAQEHIDNDGNHFKGDMESSITKETLSSAWGSHKATAWIGVVEERVLLIKETPDTTLVRVVHGSTDGITNMLHSYFQLQIPLTPLYEKWCAADPNWFARLPRSFHGVRVLQQDPVECLFSFLCSSNNNIPRITKILANIRQRYGKKLLCNVSISGDQCYNFYSFPTLEELKLATEEELRVMGLGYRAPFIIKTRDILLKKGGKDYLLSLRGHPDADFVQSELIQLSGVGRKVADCVALFSLGQVNVVPVDTHVQQIACREYCNPSDDILLQAKKSMTPTLYARIGKIFRARFPCYTGWAHSVLFVAELPSFRAALPEDMIKRMDTWKEKEKPMKKEK
jgi:N-glycosylase/DNA lyase